MAQPLCGTLLASSAGMIRRSIAACCSCDTATRVARTCEGLHNPVPGGIASEGHLARHQAAWLHTSSTSFCSTSGRNSNPSAKPDGLAGRQQSLFPDFKLQLPSNPLAARSQVPVQKLVLYRGKGMLVFRVLVRVKVFQLLGFFAAAMFASVVLTTNNPDPLDLAAVGALAVGCVVTSYCIWYYSGRYVGEMSLLLPDKNTVRFSVLDFWGNREDNDVPIGRIPAPWRHRSVAEVKAQAAQALMPIDVPGDRQYYISVPHGHILQKEVLQKLLYGKPVADDATSPAAGEAGAAGSTPAATPAPPAPTPAAPSTDEKSTS